MYKRFVGVFVFALIVALGTSAAVYKLLANKLATANAAQLKIAVPARDLPVGTVINESDLKNIDWSGELPRDSVTKPVDLIDRAVISAIHTGEVVSDARLAPKGGGAGLAATIPPGKRAIAVRVNDVVGLAGYVLPGMKVDVIALGTPPKEQDLGMQSRTLLQNVEVLSAGENIQHDRDGKPIPVQVVNLLVSPEEAEIVSLAGEAKIQLVLRNPLDQEVAKTTGTAQAYLFGGNPGHPPPKTVRTNVQSVIASAVPKPPKMETVIVPIQMEVISGAKKESVKVGQTVEERVKEEKK